MRFAEMVGAFGLGLALGSLTYAAQVENEADKAVATAAHCLDLYELDQRVMNECMDTLDRCAAQAVLMACKEE